MANELALLLRIIDDGFSKRAWHGTNLRGAIRGLSLAEAAWRPSPARHNIWEIVVHAAYWKYAVRRRLEGGKRGSFALKGSNWFPRSRDMGLTLWYEDVQLLEREHELLREVASALPVSKLHTKTPGGSVTTTTLLYGISHHDVYHAGQIQVLKRLQRA
jgi:uncharacterized damage-inducible protein DinB